MKELEQTLDSREVSEMVEKTHGKLLSAILRSMQFLLCLTFRCDNNIIMV